MCLVIAVGIIAIVLFAAAFIIIKHREHKTDIRNVGGNSSEPVPQSAQTSSTRPLINRPPHSPSQATPGTSSNFAGERTMNGVDSSDGHYIDIVDEDRVRSGIRLGDEDTHEPQSANEGDTIPAGNNR